jgi:hypothetical protein
MIRVIIKFCLPEEIPAAGTSAYTGTPRKKLRV